MELVAEDISCGVLEGEALAGGQVCIEFAEQFYALVGGLAFDGVVPGGEEFFFAILAAVGDVIYEGLDTVVGGVGLHEALGMGVGLDPLVLVAELFDVLDGLVDLLFLRGGAVGIGFGTELEGEVFVAGAVADVFDYRV